MQRAVISGEGGDGRSQGGRWYLAERSVAWCLEGGGVGGGLVVADVVDVGGWWWAGWWPVTGRVAACGGEGCCLGMEGSG